MNPFGPFGNMMPYSNFHGMNLDWVIQISKDFLDQYTHIQETIDTGLNDLQEKADALEALLQDWYDTHSEDIANQLADALQDLNAWYTEHSADIENTLALAVQQATTDFTTQANAKAAEALESIPEDYTDLYNQVQDVDDLQEYITQSIEAHQVGAKRGNVLAPSVFIHGSRTASTSAGGTVTTSIAEMSYRITNPIPFRVLEETIYKVESGFRLRPYWFDLTTGDIISFGAWTSDPYTFSPDYGYCINIARVTEDTTETINLTEAMNAVYTSPYNMLATGGNITDDNKTAITGGDLDNLPAKKVYGVAGGLTLDNSPASGGLVFGLSQNSGSDNPQVSGRVQMFIDTNGNMFSRIYWNNHFTDWKPTNHGAGLYTGNANINADNVDTLIDGDLDNLPAKKVYGVAGGLTIAHAPADGGTVFGLSQQELSDNPKVNGRAQIFIDSKGQIHSRIYWNNQFSDWKSSNYNSALLTGNANITDLNKDEITQGDLDNLPAKLLYGVAGGVSLLHAPTTLGGAVFGLSQQEVSSNPQANGRPQFYVDSHGEVYSRIYFGNAFTDWKKPMYNLNQLWANLKVLVVGDSICRGGRNSGKGFIGDTGCTYVNMGVGGATLSTVKDMSESEDTEHYVGATDIPDQLVQYSYQTSQSWYIEPDAIIGQGGINDYINNANLGTIPTVPVRSDEEANNLDLSTVSGGVQYLFWKMIKHFPMAKRYFLLAHSIGTWPWRVNTENYTQTIMNEAIKSIAGLYGVEIIDIFHDSHLNSYFNEYVSPTPYSDDHSVTNLYYVDIDRIHPLALGYKEAYAPIVSKALISTFEHT